MLGAMFSGRHRVDFDAKTGAVLIDSSDAEVFSLVLNYLRDPIGFEIDRKFDEDQRNSLCKRAQFYNMPPEFYHRLKFTTLESIQFSGVVLIQTVLNNDSRQQRRLHRHEQHRIVESAATRTRGWLDVESLAIRCSEDEFVIDYTKSSDVRFRISTITLLGQYVQCPACGCLPSPLVVTDRFGVLTRLPAVSSTKNLQTTKCNVFVFDSSTPVWLSGERLQLSFDCDQCKHQQSTGYFDKSLPRNQPARRQATIHGLYGKVSVPYSMFDAVQKQADSVRRSEQMKN